MATLTDRFVTAFPPATTPSFLVDMGPNFADPAVKVEDLKWRTKITQNLPIEDPKGAEELIASGWGALSYGWGEFMPAGRRPVYSGTRLANGLPLAVGEYYPGEKPNPSAVAVEGPTAEDLASDPPRTRAYDWAVPDCSIAFSIISAKKVLAGLGKRFVWWDWACIPQFDATRGYSWEPKSKNALIPLAKKVQDMSRGEINKQKYVYMLATVGAVWLHQLDWTKGSSPTKDMLLRALRLSVNVDDTVIEANKDHNTPAAFQAALDETAKSYKTNRDDSGVSVLLGLMTTDMRLIRKDDPWMRSLWSLQEGRQMKVQAFLDKNGQRLQAANAAPDQPPFPKLRVIENGAPKVIDSPSFKHLTTLATLMAAQLSLALNVYNTSRWATTTNSLVRLMKQDPPALKIADVEDMLRRLMQSGLVFPVGDDSPLEILAAARRTRFVSLMAADQFWAMTGVLNLVGPYEIVTKETFLQGIVTTKNSEWDAYLNRAKEKHDDYLYNELPKDFFSVLIQRHQWNALLLARKENDAVTHWGAVSLGHYEPVNPFFESSLGKDITDPLPTLTYEKATDEVVMKPNGATKIVCWSAEVLDNDTTFYKLLDEPQYTDTWANNGDMVELKNFTNYREPVPSQSIVRQKLKPAELATYFGGAGKFFLFPFKSLGVSLAGDSIQGRCLVVKKIVSLADPGKYSGVFAGIVDIGSAKATVVNVNEIRMKW